MSHCDGQLFKGLHPKTDTHRCSSSPSHFLQDASGCFCILKQLNGDAKALALNPCFCVGYGDGQGQTGNSCCHTVEKDSEQVFEDALCSNCVQHTTLPGWRLVCGTYYICWTLVLWTQTPSFRFVGLPSIPNQPYLFSSWLTTLETSCRILPLQHSP